MVNLRPRVFISYVREDKNIVERLRQDLSDRGIDVWIDRYEIKPGVIWEDAIRKAIRDGAFFIACFSRNYVRRSRRKTETQEGDRGTFMDEELDLAIAELRNRSPLSHFLIPACFP